MNQAPPDAHAPESQPPRPGRRLIRMLFRSSGEGGKNITDENQEQDNQAEDIASLKQLTDTQANSEQPPPVPATTSKFVTLKRKLFPSHNRRHPRHVPPLISPISTSAKLPLPPLGNNLKSLTRNSICRGDDHSSGQIQINDGLSCSIYKESLMSRHLAPESQEDTPESDFSLAEVDNNWGTTGRRTLVDDDDDRDLESAVEAFDLESSIVDKTLEEMSKAIEDLRAWKETHKQETQKALNELQAEQEFQLHVAKSSQDATECDDLLNVQLELKIQQQQRDREAQALEIRQEAEAYQLGCSLFKTTLDDSEATRVEQALQNNTDSGGLALSRLRNEVFQLDMKQRQEALLQELQGADSALDTNIANVQAFTTELDAILAQFDGDGVDREPSACQLKVEDEDLVI
ncbi:hypothetical protein PI124_g17402 [Phytophthora idaei]|nr:hypothetical protein PI125_g17966 [Phytophthora idaei]KAG3138930.1 hypothetical protein PI126_g16708 [Phytophthora idaei]KAG3237622.1 hypothetical protein PI124_g17402 [Phytophthora idaei]